MRSILPFDTINHTIRVSLSLYHSLSLSVLLPLSLSLSFSFRSIAHGRLWYPRGVPSFCSVLLRLVAGPVTNHDSSARERRGHTTLGSGSGACCHPPPRTPAFDSAFRALGRYPLTLLLLYCFASRPPAQLLRFATKSIARGFEGRPGCSCRCLIFATRPFVRFSTLRELFHSFVRF